MKDFYGTSWENESFDRGFIKRVDEVNKLSTVRKICELAFWTLAASNQID